MSHLLSAYARRHIFAWRNPNMDIFGHLHLGPPVQMYSWLGSIPACTWQSFYYFLARVFSSLSETAINGPAASLKGSGYYWTQCQVYIHTVCRWESDRNKNCWEDISTYQRVTPQGDTHSRFFTMLYKADNFCDFLFAFLHTKSLLKNVLLQNERICFKGKQIILLLERTLSRREILSF